MSGNNSFLKKRDERDQLFFDIGEEMGVQKMADYIAIVLHDPDCMGENAYSREQIDGFFANLQSAVDFYARAFSSHKEADHRQQQLDNALKEIYGDDFQPFRERYPHIKAESYKKAKKGWVD